MDWLQELVSGDLLGSLQNGGLALLLSLLDELGLGAGPGADG
jgi:hypothetical protein